jgi:AraC family transcriptional activator FtrA
MDQFLPNSPNGPLVVALAHEGLCTFQYGATAEIFGTPRPQIPGWYRFATCALEPGPLRAHGGLSFNVDGGAELLAIADLIVLPGWKGMSVPVPDELITALRDAHRRGARIASVCSGNAVLAATGLLDGRRAAIHWKYADALQQAWPKVIVDGNVLYIAEGKLATASGCAAGTDLLLHLVQSDFGETAATAVARRLMTGPQRDGAQTQYIAHPVATPKTSRFMAVLERVERDLAASWSVPRMATEAAMSDRNFARHFTATTGRSPSEWLHDLRIREARRLLESSSLSVESVADLSGFGSVARLRKHLVKRIGVGPREYRRKFSGRALPL